ncbi:MAG: 4Fe-4S single cluster domain-containing protein [Candidatus Binatia bacterium]
MQINLANIELSFRANGPGHRAVIWVQGCTINCPGCINAAFLNHEKRRMVTVDELSSAVFLMEIEGITFSGGEPFQQAKPLAELAKRCKGAGLSVISYSGYRRNFLENENRAPSGAAALLQQLDVLIDGPFMRRLASDTPFRGSANQTIHYLTDRYRPQDFEAVEAEVTISPNKLTSTGFFHPGKESFLLQALGVLPPENGRSVT